MILDKGVYFPLAKSSSSVNPRVHGAQLGVQQPLLREVLLLLLDRMSGKNLEVDVQHGTLPGEVS